MIKAAFFDIDGTLVDFGEKEINDEVLGSLYRLRERGVKLFICSGRPPGLLHNLRDFPFDGYCCMNGSAVFLDGEMVYSHPIDPEDAMKIAEILELNGISAASFLEKDVYVNCESDIYKKVTALLRIPPLEVKSALETSVNPVYEFTIYMTKAEEEKLFRPFLKNVSFPRWNPAFADVIRSDTDKASAMEFLIERLGILPEETIAFGDGGNDVLMIKSAGIGVAMGNADAYVRSQADFVADTASNNGVVKALRHFGLVEATTCR